MKYNPVSRRHFLQGLGGFSLALPLLPSLICKEANAAPGDGSPTFFVAMASQHGGLRNSSWYPAQLPGNESQLYSGDSSQGLDHRIRSGRLADHLTARTDAYNPQGNPELSPVLGAFLNPHLDRINLIRGLDLMFGGGHHSGGYLGNYHGNNNRDFNTQIDSDMLLPPMVSIDQIIGNSNAFYSANDPMTVRSINVLAYVRSLSWIQNGNMIVPAPVPGWGRAAALFDSIFGSGFGGSETPDAPSSTVVDTVLADYQRLTNSSFGPGRRISSDDRIRLNQFIDELNELQRKVTNQAATCENVQRPGQDDRFTYDDNNLPRIQQNWDIYLDVVMAAFRCGRTRIATLGIDKCADYSGDWHQDIAHQHYSDGPQHELILAHRFIAQHIFTRLLDKLNVDMGLGDGSTYLDHSLVVWNHESSANTHDGDCLPTITAGGANGYFNTGQYLDYRNLSNLGLTRYRDDKRPGLPHNRWLYTILRAFQIPDSAFARPGMYGYGDHYQHPQMASFQNHDSWPQRVLNDCNQVLPLLAG